MKIDSLILSVGALGLFMGCTGVKVDDDSNSGEDSGDSSSQNTADLYGPENEWYHSEVADVPSPDNCGFGQGDYACNFTMIDQNGDEVELYQFAGKYVVLDLFAEW